jgi:nitrite reductase/ring-hydroxylating ferredoxin subunit
MAALVDQAGDEARTRDWRRAIALDRLDGDGKAVVKIGNKQLALFRTPDGILACNNRCPHEGYPLREGTLDGSCVLTCNWHNWKFDLKTGANLYGGDRLRIYPTRVTEGAVWVDITDPPAAERRAEIVANLRAAFDDHEYDRMAREVARLALAGGDPVAAVATAIDWSHDRLEFGTTHAIAAAPGWIALHDEARDPELRLACLVEAIGHMAWDVLREPAYPYPEAVKPWDEADFLAAIEGQDEAGAIARLRGALADGLHFGDLEHALTASALSHYANFGHALIYVVHAGRLIARLGQEVEAPVLLALVRSHVYASREDLIPEFRGYGPALAAWPKREARAQAAPPSVESLRAGSLDDLLARVVEAAGQAAPEALYQSLFGAEAANLLQFDTRWESKIDSTVAQNVGWLDFTHGLTFGNAVRLQCERFPALWPPALLQMACFVGRNIAFTNDAPQLAAWRVTDREAFYAKALERIADHGEDQYILSTHFLKTYHAACEEVAAGLPSAIEAVTLAALNRFLNAPVKRRHVRRTAHQALMFVAREG